MGSTKTMILERRKWKWEVERLLVKMFANWSPVEIYFTSRSQRSTFSRTKMVIHLHMLCTSMKHRIGGDGKSRDIITPEFGRKGKKDAKILENLSKPTKLSSNGCKSSIFWFSGRLWHCVLFLSTLGNGIVTNVN